MKEFRETFAMMSCDIETLTPSAIHCMEIMDECPDDNETTQQVADQN